MEEANVQLNKSENVAFRYLYGFAILFVVLSHCDGGGFEMLSNWMHFGAFHLAIFVFGSGYFKKKSEYKKPARLLLKKMKKLLLPLWIWNFVYALIMLLLQKIGFSFECVINLKTILVGPINNKDLFILNMGSWFVFPFFMVQVLYLVGKCILDRLKKENVTDYIWEVCCFIAGVVCVYLVNHGMQSEHLLFLYRTMYFMPFYILGIWYRNYLENYLDKLPKILVLSACLIIALSLNTYFGRVVYAIPSSCDYPFGVVATFIAAITGIVFWLTVSKALGECEKKVAILTLFGNYTFDIMFHQFLGILIVKTVFFFLYKCFGIFADFDPVLYKSDIWYLYLPKGIAEYKTLYVIGAIAFSVCVGKAFGWLKQKMKSKTQK